MDEMKLKASTLMESMVAMVVVMLCFGIASMIYVNVMNSKNKRIELHAHLLLNNIAIQTKKLDLFIDEEIREGEIIITKKVETYKEISGLSWLKLTALDANGKIIATHNALICTECTGN